MTVKIKEISYLLPPRDSLNDALDVFITLDDDYCTQGFCYFIEVTTLEYLSTLMQKENNGVFLLPDFPCIIVSELTDDVIRTAVESFVNSEDEARWLKLYHLLPSLSLEDINKILYQKKQEEIELGLEVDAEFEDE